MRPSPLSPFDSANGRQSPFRRQNSVSPATVRTTTPTQSPTKAPSSLSPTKNGSLSPEKTSPFVRRPSQMNQTSGRPASPFARPGSSLSMASSPNKSMHDELKSENEPSPVAALKPTRQASVAPASDDDEDHGVPSPSPFDAKPAASAYSPITSPSAPIPSQANLRPSAQRTTTASTVRPPTFNPQAYTSSKTSATNTRSYTANTPSARGAYTHLNPALLHSMRESFQALDAPSTGMVDAAAVAAMLTSQLDLPADAAALAAYFPAGAPAQLSLARYLDVLAGPLAALSPPEELRAAFEAFDIDDSGQIDTAGLREALLRAPPPGPGEGEGEVLSAAEVDAVLAEFSGRRAFGPAAARGKAMGKGEVFRYREFMASVTAGGGVGGGPEDGLGGVVA